VKLSTYEKEELKDNMKKKKKT